LLSAFRLLILAIAISGPIMAQTSSLAASRKVQLNFELKDLTEPLRNLSVTDREAVDQAIRSIGQKEHAVALSYLTQLSSSNPMNSSLRVLRAFVLLELGNVSGALGEARTAEDTGAHAAYRCWFLAQVAYLAGNKPLCRREIKHLTGNATYGADAEKLRQDLNSRSK
jgi:predicted Zn-dependent protease